MINSLSFSVKILANNLEYCKILLKREVTYLINSNLYWIEIPLESRLSFLVALTRKSQLKLMQSIKELLIEFLKSSLISSISQKDIIRLFFDGL